MGTESIWDQAVLIDLLPRPIIQMESCAGWMDLFTTLINALLRFSESTRSRAVSPKVDKVRTKSYRRRKKRPWG